MKPQDIVFFAILGLFILRRDSKLVVLAGLTCLVLAIPFFATWTFFTAERLTWYGAAFFFYSNNKSIEFYKKGG